MNELFLLINTTGYTVRCQAIPRLTIPGLTISIKAAVRLRLRGRMRGKEMLQNWIFFSSSEPWENYMYYLIYISCIVMLLAIVKYNCEIPPRQFNGLLWWIFFLTSFHGMAIWPHLKWFLYLKMSRTITIQSYVSTRTKQNINSLVDLSPNVRIQW